MKSRSPQRKAHASKSASNSPIRKAALDVRLQDVWTVWYAAQYGKIPRLAALLERDPVLSVDVQEPRTRWSPLHFACRFGQIETVEFLLARGANPELPDWNGNTPLHLSAGWGNTRCCILVLERGADVRLTNNEGETALAVAKSLARQDIASLLSNWKAVGLSREELAEQRAQMALQRSATQSAFAIMRLLDEEPPEAIRLELHALNAKVASFGRRHAGILLTMGKLMMLLRADSSAHLALEVIEDALTLCEDLYGRSHPETATWLSHAGELMLLSNRPVQAVDHFQEALATLVELRGEMDHDALVALENVCIVCYQSKDWQHTEQQITHLLDLLRDVYNGGYNDKVWGLTMTLATVVMHQMRVNEARQLYEDCLDHAELMFGKDAVQVAACTDGIGRCWFAVGDFDRAETLFLRSMQIYLLSEQRSSPQLQRAHNNLAMIAIARRSAVAVRQQLHHGADASSTSGPSSSTLMVGRRAVSFEQHSMTDAPKRRSADMASNDSAKTLYCIRHGESTFNEWRKRSILTFSWVFVRDPMIIDAPLSAKGEQQALALSEKLQSQSLHAKIEVVVMSPLTRAIQTAMGAFKDVQVPMQAEPLCREMLDTACDIGRQPQELARVFASPLLQLDHVEQYWWLPESKRPPTVPESAMKTPATSDEVMPLRETSEDLDRRIGAFVQTLAAMPQQHIAVVGHSSFFKRMLGMNRKLNNCELYVTPLADVLKRYPVASNP
ncbi:TPA: hypothetical protein N0F65_008570 [Lagenidium giganteum]|uniref:Uncharacterized protein n=1 Tax=Lagenidium giganteum TaxID=4803 RepID=A0AAV2YI76_9STRA|nr:TPA: hypothetical protein N0F65_008570 [Lagenidium giganteum]